MDDLPSPQKLAALYADMTRALRTADYGPDTPAMVTALAVTAIPGVEQASISEGRHGRFRTLASTGDIATLGDRIQYELGSGPCVDAILNNTMFATADIARDTRWTEFGARVHAETGTTSMLSLRLFTEGDDREPG